jgi:pilus assembly protein CpaE
LLDCALISSDEGFRHTVLGLIRQPEAQARLALDLQTTADGMSRETVAKLVQAAPRVVFLDLGQDPSGVGGVQVLSQKLPDTALIVAGPVLSAEGLLAVMRAGATEYLPRPLSREETLEAFSRTRRRTKSPSLDTRVSVGRVTTVFSAKGGTGVTTVATNLAISLHRLTKKDTLLLDLTPALGTAAVAMGVQPRYTYMDVIQNFHRIDEELFRSFLESHESGVHILASPLSPVDRETPTGDEILSLVRLCKQHFDYVVVDGGNSISEDLRPLLSESDDRLLVVTADLSALRNLRRALDLFGKMNGQTPSRLILNQYKEGLGLSSRDVEDGLGYPLAAILEKDDARVLQSINVGRPEVLAGHSRFARGVMGLGSELAGPDKIAPTQRGFFSRIFRSSKGPDKSKKERT